ncbi:MAG: DNA ligase [Rhodoferax sp.]|nr:DNA ligase [Rhodoferax sp.]
MSVFHPLPSLPQPGRRSLLLALASCCVPAGAQAASGLAAPLMLAKSWDVKQDLGGFWVSEKFDGVRGYWDGHRLLTRAGNPIAAPAWFTAGWPSVPLDGELWVGRGQFSQAVSTVRDQTPDEAAWRKLQYRVFDLPAHGAQFDERIPALRAVVQQIHQPWVLAVDQSPASTTAALQAQLRTTVQAGGEGLMLHRGSAHYVARRSDDLRKFKPFDDAEARVVNHVPGRGKYAGQLGALWVEPVVVEGRTRQGFKLGTGFSDAQRRNPPP